MRQGTSGNHRTAHRFSVEAPVYLGETVAHTRDMSVSGVYFEVDENFAPGASLEFAVDLRHVRPEGPVRLICTGKIVRVERHGGRVGVAVAFDTQRFEFIGEKTTGARRERGSHWK